MAATTDHSPFLYASSAHIDAHPVHDASEPFAHEPASDGLAVFKHPQRSMLSWFRGYTRAGCRCGQCPLGQEEPCEYALPERWVGSLAARLDLQDRCILAWMTVGSMALCAPNQKNDPHVFCW
jgi:hypothetical protein